MSLFVNERKIVDRAIERLLPVGKWFASELSPKQTILTILSQIDNISYSVKDGEAKITFRKEF